MIAGYGRATKVLSLERQPARPRGIAGPALRLFCLPATGGSVREFGRWAGDLPKFAEVCPLELPGHGRRCGEAPIGELGPLTADLLSTVLPLANEDFSILGYGYGALLGFELACRLEHHYGVTPRQLFVAASRAPVWPRCPNPLSRLSDAELGELLRDGDSPLPGLGGVAEFIIRVLRADLSVADSYRFDPGARLTCPITAFRGTDDPAVSAESLQAWSVCTDGAFTWREIPGGHLFLPAGRRAFLESLSQELNTRAGGQHTAAVPRRQRNSAVELRAS